MGTIAEKLTYLNTTKIKLRDSLNKFGSSILSTDTFRSYDTKLNEIYDKLPKVTGNGSEFTLTPVQNGQVDDFKMIGTDLEQETVETITVSDWEQGTIDTNGTLSNSTTEVRTSNFIKVYPNILYNISRTIYNSFMKFRFYDNNKNYLGSQADINVTTDNSSNRMETNVSSMKLTINDNDVSYIKLVDSSNDLSTIYTLTTNVTPSPIYPQEIKVVEGRQVITDKGKNIYDEEYELGYYNIPDGTKVYPQDSYGYRSTNLNELKPNTEYKISVNGELFENSIRLFYYDKNKTFLSTSSTSSGKFTTPNNCYYFAWHSSYLRQIFQDGIEKLMFSDTIYSLDYEPYHEPVDYNIDLQSENLSNGVNKNYWLNTAVVTAGVANNNTGLAIDVRNLGIIIIETSVTQTRYRVACVNTLPQTSSQVDVNKGINKDNTSSSITIDTTGYNYLIINATDLSSLNVYYKYELAKIPNTAYKNRIYKSNGNWYFEENVKKYIFNSAKVLAVNDYQSSSTGTSKNGTYSIVVSDMPISLRNDKMMSTEYSYELNSNVTDNYSAQTNMTNNTFCLRQGTNDRIYFKCSDYANKTASEISTAIENESMYYVLANPVTTQITNTTLINQLEAISVHTGTNIITLSSDNNMTPEIEITRLKELERLS